MSLTQSESMTFQVASAIGSAASAAGSVATTSWTMDLLGVPISAVLAAFAGAGFVLAWLPMMPIGRLVSTVFFAAFTAMYGAPIAVKAWVFLEGAQLLVTLLIAAGLQVAMPILIEKRVSIFNWALSRLPGGKADERGGGQ